MTTNICPFIFQKQYRGWFKIAPNTLRTLLIFFHEKYFVFKKIYTTEYQIQMECDYCKELDLGFKEAVS